MKGELFIDGVDVYTTYGVSLANVAYEDVVCLPHLKPVPYNDWHEKNGIEPDLSAPVIAAKNITLKFNVSSSSKGYNAFLDALSDKAYHTFNFAEIGLTKELRLKSCGDLGSIQDLGLFSLTFSDDEPMNDYSYSAPSSKWEQLGDYLLDGIDFANYGIRMLRGTMDSVMQRSDVKENLKRDISTKSGVVYDGEKVTYKSRTAKLRCLMRAANSQEFWRNRNALVYDLSKPGERILTVSELGKEIPCFYKGCNVHCFFPDHGKFWFEFTLNLEFFKGVI